MKRPTLIPRLFLLPILVFTVLLGFLTLSQDAYSKKNTSDFVRTSKDTIVLEGFKPSASVNYAIFANGKTLKTGSAQINAKGELLITHPRPRATLKDNVVYDFDITDGDNHFDLLVRMNGKAKKMSISGDGLTEFSDISVITSSDRLQTKSDWSGGFEKEDIATNPLRPSFEIALHGLNDLAPISQKQNPAIIKIISAQGGGGPTNSGVNKYKVPVLKSSFPKLSVDDTTHIDGTIQSIIENYVYALMLMTEQLNSVVMQSTMAIGTFFDAKMQLETQREFERLKAQAHKDYHPSEEMCRVGSFMRSVATTEHKALANQLALNTVMMSRYTNRQHNDNNGIQADIPARLTDARLTQFREVYCDRADHNGGLDYMCDHDQDNRPADPIGGTDQDRMNKDIDFLRTAYLPKTLDMNFQDDESQPDEQDVIALGQNLYWPNFLNLPDPKKMTEVEPGFKDMRRLIALNSIAHNSYTNLTSLKSRAEEPAGNLEPGWMFMKTMMRDFGIPDDEIETMLGEYPSYWAQMEVLTKKMLQHPDFYTNLYDKPNNVERMAVALEAIRLMQMRDYYNSMTRKEMLSAAQLETELVNSGSYSRVKKALSGKP